MFDKFSSFKFIVIFLGMVLTSSAITANACDYHIYSGESINKYSNTVSPGETVCIHQGTYQETLKPGTSGSAEQGHITYMAFPGDEVTITQGALYGVDLRYRHYIIIDGFRIIDTRDSWIIMSGYEGGVWDYNHTSTHNIVKNCYMKDSGSWGGIYMRFGVEYNKFINNTLIGRCTPADLVYCTVGCKYNVFEGNDFQFGPHNGFDFQGDSEKNVIRNNTFQNYWHTTMSLYKNPVRNLVEKNKFFDAGRDFHCNEGECGALSDRMCWAGAPPAPWRHPGLQYGASKGIIRRNVFVNCGVGIGLGSNAPVADNRIFHNVFHDNYAGIYSENSSTAVTNNYFVNNIFYKNKEYEIYMNDNIEPYDDVNYFISNSIFGNSPIISWKRQNKSLPQIEQELPAYWKGNFGLDPQFTDIAGRNFELQGSSPMISAGAFLTKANSSGSGTVIVVEDASYFYDGWGIPGEQGDMIQLEGQTLTTRITSIDYDNNRITVDRSLTWSTGQGVSLAYSGSAPDIGAFEYQASILYGDVSENGSISAYDASLTAQHAVGITTLTPEQQTKADVSGEGSVSAFDASWIARKVVDESVVFPVEE